MSSQVDRSIGEFVDEKSMDKTQAEIVNKSIGLLNNKSIGLLNEKSPKGPNTMSPNKEKLGTMQKSPKETSSGNKANLEKLSGSPNKTDRMDTSVHSDSETAKNVSFMNSRLFDSINDTIEKGDDLEENIEKSLTVRKTDVAKTGTTLTDEETNAEAVATTAGKVEHEMEFEESSGGKIVHEEMEVDDEDSNALVINENYQDSEDKPEVEETPMEMEVINDVVPETVDNEKQLEVSEKITEQSAPVTTAKVMEDKEKKNLLYWII
ncbi:chromatin modification-related protein EAF7-like [Diaphorina citri]|uniref:Chromatin modification-related protein EAF7-like n=1 Tax=Diaphorina citri TaxID=121845 RepID=A0A3Q0JJD9_DIACI|nr:chromatin modification-related protein EAF7-like [Diaphorina citri]